MIQNLKLQNFRNFENKTLEFSDGLTIIVGDNGVGKTNILEAVNLLATGKSFKADRETETITYNKSIAGITGITGITSLEVKITSGENGWPRKKLLVNGVPKRLIDFAGNLKTVLFGPWDMDLVTSSPSLRRKFFDNVLSQTDREYRRSILSYEKGLRQRNRLLFRIREEGLSRGQLVFWNQLLIKNGDYIMKKREEFIEFTNNTNNPIYTNYQLNYDRSVISEGRLEQYKDAEIASATTLVGPHRDDFVFQIRNSKHEIRNLASYGSRGEQRMGVLWLKMAELAYIEEMTTDKPTLLLDDIFSELDHSHRDIVMESIKNHQVIMTTADEYTISKNGATKIIKLFLT